MKRLIFFVFSFVFLFSIAKAEPEITFQGIPWLSDDAGTFQMLREKGLIREGVELPPFSNEKNEYIVTDDEVHFRPDIIVTEEEICWSTSLETIAKGRIAGYPVKNLVLNFAYNGTYQLIAIKVELIKGNFHDLKTKLITQYGEGNDAITNEGMESIIWKGSNNSAIMLYTQSEGSDYTLIYGRTDTTEIITNCMVINPNEVAGL